MYSGDQSAGSQFEDENSLSIRTNQSTPIKRADNTSNRTSLISDDYGLRKISSTSGVLDEKQKLHRRYTSRIRNINNSTKSTSSIDNYDDISDPSFGKKNTVQEDDNESELTYELPPLKTPLKINRHSVGSTFKNHRFSDGDWKSKLRPTSTTSFNDADALNDIFENEGVNNSRSPKNPEYYKVDFSSPQQNVAVDQLNKQIVSYRLKIKSLYEIIRQLSSNSENEDRKRNSYMESILSKLPQDDEVEELKRANINLEHQLSKKNTLLHQLENSLHTVSDELEKTKNDHAETLEMTKEYLEHTEELTKQIDNILGWLLNELELNADEKTTLENARKIGTAFTIVKMKALESIIQQHILDKKSGSPIPKDSKDGNNELSKQEHANESEYAIANSTAIQNHLEEDSYQKTKDEDEFDDNLLNSQMEEAIEELHREYDSFVKGIREKLEKSEKLEAILLDKLSLQKSNLVKLADSTANENNMSKDVIETSELGDQNNKTNMDFYKSYQYHIDNLTSHIERLKLNISERDEAVDYLKEEEEQLRIEIQKQKERFNRQMADKKELYMQKESNWKELIASYEDQLEEVNLSRKQLSKTVSDLKNEIQEIYQQSSENMKLLEQDVASLQEKCQSYNDEVFQLSKQNSALSAKLEAFTKNSENLKLMFQQLEKSAKNNQKSLNETKPFTDSLLDHLNQIFDILAKVLDDQSISQARRKLRSIIKISTIEDPKLLTHKLITLYEYIERAAESIVTNYIEVNSVLQSQPAQTKDQKQLLLRIEDVQRKWLSERERRKLESDIAQSKIKKLELENLQLREQLRKAP